VGAKEKFLEGCPSRPPWLRAWWWGSILLSYYCCSALLLPFILLKT